MITSVSETIARLMTDIPGAITAIQKGNNDPKITEVDQAIARLERDFPSYLVPSSCGEYVADIADTSHITDPDNKVRALRETLNALRALSQEIAYV